MADVFFYEAFEEEADALQRLLPEQVAAGFSWKTIQERADAEPPAPVISIRTQSQIPVSWAGKLSGILARASGYNHLATYRLKAQSDIPCGYLPVYASRSVAEQAMLMWMALGRKLLAQTRRFRTFHRDGLTGTEFAGKNLLVVGVGNIGREVVRIGKGLGMLVRGVDVVQRHPDVAYVSIEEGLPSADVIVCAMNLTPENVGYFDYDRLVRARRCAIFVNIARGEHSPAAYLLRLLEEGRLGGVGLDVYEHEQDLGVALREGRAFEGGRFQAVEALAQRPDVILTPHNAFNTREAVERKAGRSVEQLVYFQEHGRFRWAV